MCGNRSKSKVEIQNATPAMTDVGLVGRSDKGDVLTGFDWLNSCPAFDIQYGNVRSLPTRYRFLLIDSPFLGLIQKKVRQRE